MRKILFLVISYFLIFHFALAQNVPYFSLKKANNGLMIGAEIINQKTKQSLKPTGYIYEWVIPDFSLIPKKTYVNNFFIALNRFYKLLFLNLTISKPLSQENYSFRNVKLSLPKAKVKIIRKHNGLFLPLVGKVKQDDSLTAITKNFASTNLTYSWDFNGAFISNEKEILVKNLKEKSGTIKIKVFGSLSGETAEDSEIIQIE